MLWVRDCVELCRDGSERGLDIDKVQYSVMHRITFEDDDGGGHWLDVHPIPRDELTGPLVAARFRDRRRLSSIKQHWKDRPGSYTKGEMPYAFVISTIGAIDQCLRLSDHGPHARRWSSAGVGIAFVGDFTKHGPTRKQIEAAEELLPLLAAIGMSVVGHTDLQGASGDPSKVCPGHLFPTDSLAAYARDAAGAISEQEAIAILVGAGVVF